MPSMADLKIVGLCALGVIVAGIILNKGRGISILADAHEGFDYIG